MDTYHRGLITLEAFSRAMEGLGVQQGGREFATITRYCRIVDEGYVVYKEWGGWLGLLGRSFVCSQPRRMLLCLDA